MAYPVPILQLVAMTYTSVQSQDVDPFFDIMIRPPFVRLRSSHIVVTAAALSCLILPRQDMLNPYSAHATQDTKHGKQTYRMVLLNRL